MSVILNPENYKENMLWSIGLSVLCNIKFNELTRTAAQDPILVEESDSLYVDDYNFVFHILPPGMR